MQYAQQKSENYQVEGSLWKYDFSVNYTQRFFSYRWKKMIEMIISNNHILCYKCALEMSLSGSAADSCTKARNYMLNPQIWSYFDDDDFQSFYNCSRGEMMKMMPHKLWYNTVEQFVDIQKHVLSGSVWLIFRFLIKPSKFWKSQGRCCVSVLSSYFPQFPSLSPHSRHRHSSFPTYSGQSFDYNMSITVLPSGVVCLQTEVFRFGIH